MRQRGGSLLGVTMALAALGAVVLVGLDARVHEQDIASRARCRAAARWAAESAVARGRARLARGLRGGLSGELAGGARYRLAARATRGGVVLEGTGRCAARGRAIEQVVRVKVDRRGAILLYEEGPPPLE